MENINNTFFDGYYKEVWKTIIPAELTTREVDFMIAYFDLQAGQHVLDMMCGYGRHAIALARKGIQVTAVDNLGDYIDEIEAVAHEEKLPLQAVQADIAKFNPANAAPADLAICMGNSFNFFSAEEATAILANLYGLMKNGGQLLINTWSLTEIAVKQFTPRSWSYAGDLRIISESAYLFSPSRIETKQLILAPDGSTETKEAVDYIFSIPEMEALLQRSGFRVKEVYSIPGRKKFALGDPRAYIIAEKEQA